MTNTVRIYCRSKATRPSARRHFLGLWMRESIFAMPIPLHRFVFLLVRVFFQVSIHVTVGASISVIRCRRRSGRFRDNWGITGTIPAALGKMHFVGTDVMHGWRERVGRDIIGNNGYPYPAVKDEHYARIEPEPGTGAKQNKVIQGSSRCPTRYGAVDAP